MEPFANSVSYPVNTIIDVLLCTSASFLDCARIIWPSHITARSPWSQYQTPLSPFTSLSNPLNHCLSLSPLFFARAIHLASHGHTKLPHDQLSVLTTLKYRRAHLLWIPPVSQRDRSHIYREQKSQIANLVCCLCSISMQHIYAF